MFSNRLLRAAALFAALALLHPRAVSAAPGFAAPGRGEALSPGAIVEVRWTPVCESSAGADEAELVLSLDGGLTFPVRVSHELSR